MKTKKFAALAASALALGAFGAVGAPTTANAVDPTPVTVAFNADTAGAKPNGYISPDSPALVFLDTVGTTLQVQDFGVQSHGQAIAVVAGGTNALEIRLTSPTTKIKMGFGNDDPALSNPTDQAQLVAFRGATQVGVTQVNFNSNDIMDQTIGFDGPLFNRVVLTYVTAAGVPIAVAEVADDITVAPLCTISGNAGNNNLNGTAGDDVICGDAGNDLINGRGGNDLIYPGTGNDVTNAGAGNDTVIDDAGADTLIGGPGADDLRGSRGDDRLLGGRGADVLAGSAGRDNLNGGAGGDTCNGGAAVDTATKCEIRIRIP